MSPLDRKLLRDLWRLRGQVLAVALIVASGVAVLVMALTSLEALGDTATAYYERYRFAQVFANAKRVPAPLAARIEAIPGVQTVETRISEMALADIEDFVEPVMTRLVSVPEHGQPTLNRLALRSGRWVRPGHPEEAIVSEPFAEAHGLGLGDEIAVIMRGHKRGLRIVGTALSPEFVYAISPGGLMPDDELFGVLWLGQGAMEAAFDLEGAFNDVTLSLLRGVEPQAVIDRLDRLLDRYGSLGAFARKDQVSNWFLMNELRMLRNMSNILPTIFLAVAAFLTNTVLARLIAIERSEIGVLKAFGYGDLAVGWHYAKMAMAMAGLGVLIGWGIGYWLGFYNTSLYAAFFRFPFLLFQPGPMAFAIGAAVSLAAALLGAIAAVSRAVSLQPAEAMRPPSPPAYNKGLAGAAGFARWLDQPTRMILRQILRWPLRSAMTATGVGLAVAVLITAMQWLDGIDHMVEVHFFEAQHRDATVALVEPQGERVVREMAGLPGVLAAESSRAVTVRFRAGTRSHRGGLTGVRPDARLQLVYDASGRSLQVPPEGLVLSTKLAEKLALRAGDEVQVEVLEGRRPVKTLPVVALFETYIGTPAYIHVDALNRLMKEPRRVGQVSLLIDESKEAALFRALKETPEVSAVMLRRAAVDNFHETMGETLMIFVSFFIAFSCTLAVGVLYNAARIALSERGRELATLRVLGFNRREIAYFLLGEVGLLVFAALPVGCLLGYALVWLMTSTFETELFRVPFWIEDSTFGWAVAITLVAALISGLLVRRRLGRLDLIAVLKTRE